MEDPTAAHQQRFCTATTLLTDERTTVSGAPRFIGWSSTVTAKTTDIALATARVGYAADNWLFYVKGGGAWSKGSSAGSVFRQNGALFQTTTTSTDRSGWVVGGGIEWGFAPNWSAKIEYNHIDFGSQNVTVVGTANTSFVSSSSTIDLVKAGITTVLTGRPRSREVLTDLRRI